jgi:hypothetical protein
VCDAEAEAAKLQQVGLITHVAPVNHYLRSTRMSLLSIITWRSITHVARVNHHLSCLTLTHILFFSSFLCLNSTVR